MHAFCLKKKVVTVQLFLNTDFRHIFQTLLQFSPRRLITGCKSSNFLLLLSTWVLSGFQSLKSLTTILEKVPMSLRNPTVPYSLRQLLQSDLLGRILHNSDKISWVIQKASWLNVPGKFVSTTLLIFSFFNSFKVP